MKNLMCCGVAGFSGKTAVILGLALSLQERGKKVGYFKPFANHNASDESGKPVDEDVLLMQDVLDLEYDYNEIAPITLPSHDFTRQCVEMTHDRAWETIEVAFSSFKDADIVLIEGLSDPFRGLSIGLSAPTLAKRLDCRLLMSIKPSTATPCRVYDYILGLKDYFSKEGVKTAGAVLNQAYTSSFDSMRWVIDNAEAQGISTWMIPENLQLTSPTVGDIVRELNATVLCGDDHLHLVCERTMIAAMRAQSALGYFRRVSNKAVITGGDRTDVSLAALETSTNCLILTGNLYPEAQVLSEARAKEVPVILVTMDTATTLKNIESLPWRLRPEDTEKIAIAKEAVKENIDFDKLLNE